MARFTTNLTVTTPNESVSAIKAGDYDVALKLNSEVDSSDTPITLISSASLDFSPKTSSGVNVASGSAVSIVNISSIDLSIILSCY